MSNKDIIYKRGNHEIYQNLCTHTGETPPTPQPHVMKEGKWGEREITSNIGSKGD